MKIPSWLRELYESSRLWIPLIAFLAWFWFWFQLLGVTDPTATVFIVLFNPFTMRAVYRMWVHRDSFILPYEYMKSFWRQRREMKKQERQEERK